MANIIKILRSITAGARPSGAHQYGEPYVNFSDNQMGAMNSGNVAQDFIGVPFFSPSTSYNSGQGVNYQGQLLIAKQAITPGIFNPLQWSPIVTQAGYGGSVNKFRNPSFLFWQHGTSVSVPSNSSNYTADGWVVGSYASAITVASTPLGGVPGDALALSNYAMQLSGATGNTSVYINQRIEAFYSMSFYVAPVTVQFKPFNNTGSTITPALTIYHPTALNNFSTVTTDISAVNTQPCPNGVWTTIAYTFTLPFASVINGLGIWVQFAGLNASGHTVLITDADIRLTPGYPVGLCNYPPMPELLSPELDYLNNLRYFQNPASYELWSGYVQNGQTYGINTKLIVPMRTTPTLAYSWSTFTGFSSWNPNTMSPTAFETMFVGSSTIPNGFAQFTWTANAEL